MSEGIIILMIGVSTFLGAIGLVALIWAVRTGQFDDESKFIDAARHDNIEDLQDAAMMQAKREAYTKKKNDEKKESSYRPPD
jgi:cbb3-type cytochrome oxidase maturation protein